MSRDAAAGLALLLMHAAGLDRPLDILTHCAAGWLATIDWGTATAPLYLAHDAGMAVHVWVDRTRPYNQVVLAAFELASHGVPRTFIVDDAGGLLMQQEHVDAVIIETDRVTADGHVCDNIGTYLKALAAHAHGIPFHVALPSTTYDPVTPAGAAVPIEARAPDEVR